MRHASKGNVLSAHEPLRSPRCRRQRRRRLMLPGAYCLPEGCINLLLGWRVCVSVESLDGSLPLSEDIAGLEYRPQCLHPTPADIPKTANLAGKCHTREDGAGVSDGAWNLPWHPQDVSGNVRAVTCPTAGREATIIPPVPVFGFSPSERRRTEAPCVTLLKVRFDTPVGDLRGKARSRETRRPARGQSAEDIEVLVADHYPCCHLAKNNSSMFYPKVTLSNFHVRA